MKGKPNFLHTLFRSNPACVRVGKRLSKATNRTCTVRAAKGGAALYSAQKLQYSFFTFDRCNVQEFIVLISTTPISKVGAPINLLSFQGSSGGTVCGQIMEVASLETVTENVLTASQSGIFTVRATNWMRQLLQRHLILYSSYRFVSDCIYA
jgi:hypothetical protein